MVAAFSPGACIERPSASVASTPTLLICNCAVQRIVFVPRIVFSVEKIKL